MSKLRADGGTEMAGALAFALDGRDTPGFLRQVVFMTDGAVGNEDQLFKLIAQRLGSTRLFTVGIGSAPNSHFMTKAAQFGRGTFTYIGDLREVQDKMARLFAKIESPVLRDVSIRWPDGTPVETFPARVPDLYLGEPIVVAAAHPALDGDDRRLRPARQPTLERGAHAVAGAASRPAWAPSGPGRRSRA